MYQQRRQQAPPTQHQRQQRQRQRQHPEQHQHQRPPQPPRQRSQAQHPEKADYFAEQQQQPSERRPEEAAGGIGWYTWAQFQEFHAADARKKWRAAGRWMAQAAIPKGSRGNMRPFNNALTTALNPTTAPAEPQKSQPTASNPSEQRPQLEGDDINWYTRDEFQQYFSPAGGKVYNSRWRAAGMWLKRAGFSRDKRTTREHLERNLRRTAGPEKPTGADPPATQHGDPRSRQQPNSPKAKGQAQQQQSQQRKAAPPDSPRPRRRAEPSGRPAE
eukprot:gene2715-2943_t